ncbi:MAG: ABC transporter ATP-binding protein, partial [Finegoldia magna]|nr:ABC transporter ATP-binding protein [Finegoldia magna]
VIIYFLFTNFFKKKIHELSKIYIKTLSDSRNTLISLMNRIVSIKINSYEKYSYKIYDKSIVDKRDSNIKLGVMRNTGKITINYLLYLMPFIVLLMGSLMTVDKLFTIGSIIAYLDYLTKMITSLEELNELNFNFAAAKISSERINEVINLKTISEKDELSTEINMRDISVSFNGNIILNDIELKIKDCDKVSIIGKSGSGKSTLVDIITGNQTADNGDIDFGQLKDYNGAYIPPEPYIFQGDLEDNIVLDSDFNVKQYQKVLDICLIDPHEAPYNGSLNNLSYGEKQRVELARALYKGKNTLIIDEGISNIDLNDLNLIIDNLLNLENLTLIYISHNQEIARKFPLQAKLKDKKLIFEK